MSYFNYDHGDWMQRAIDAVRRRAKTPAQKKRIARVPEKLNEFQLKVCDIVGIAAGGIYNAPIPGPEHIDWNYGTGVSMTWGGDVSTWDSNALTLLVLLCHEARIRLAIDAAAPRRLRLSFWQRGDAGGIAVRHPTIDEAIERVRAALPAGHRIRWAKRAEGGEEAA